MINLTEPHMTERTQPQPNQSIRQAAIVSLVMLFLLCALVLWER